jgi:hypothetical protein
VRCITPYKLYLAPGLINRSIKHKENAPIVKGVDAGLPSYEGSRVRDYIARGITFLIQAEEA